MHRFLVLSCASAGLGDDVKGIDIFYTAQCPFTVPYIKLLDPVIQSSSVPVRVHPIMTHEMARDHRAPLTTYSVFVDGKFYTREVLTPVKYRNYWRNSKFRLGGVVNYRSVSTVSFLSM